MRDTSAALAERITRDINAYTFGLINATNVTASAAVSTYIGATPTLADFAGLYALAENSDIPVDRCVVVLNPTYYSKVLPLVTYNMVGKEDYIETGVIRGLIGFKGVVCSSNLPDGTVGAILLDEAMGIASKYLAPMTPGAYPEAWSATSDEGFTIGFRRFMDLNTGSDKFAVDCLYGAKLLQANKCVRLTA